MFPALLIQPPVLPPQNGLRTSPSYRVLSSKRQRTTKGVSTSQLGGRLVLPRNFPSSIPLQGTSKACSRAHFPTSVSAPHSLLRRVKKITYRRNPLLLRELSMRTSSLQKPTRHSPLSSRPRHCSRRQPRRVPRPSAVQPVLNFLLAQVKGLPRSHAATRQVKRPKDR